MTDFVLENHGNQKDYFKYICFNCANFLKQPLELWMFIPCDCGGNIFEEPKWENEETDYEIQILVQEYQQAKERCLFEGFEVVKDKYKSTKREIIYLPNTEKQVWRRLTYHTGEVETFFFDYYEQFRIVEHLIKYNLQLTPTALKQIRL